MKRLYWFPMLWAFGFYLLLSVQGAFAQSGSLTSGDTASGSLAAGQTHTYMFTANVGEAVYFNASGAGTVRMTFYKPSGSYYTYANTRKQIPNVPNTGVWTVQVKYTSTAVSGSYELHYLRGGDSVENGTLTSGGTRSSSLNPIDQDSYTFTANAGEAVYFNASGAGTVQMTFYTPDGAYYTYSNTRKHLSNLPATGEYTVHVQYTSYAASGSYDLHYLRGGDSVENGALTSGGTRSSSLNPIDQDSYTFTANAGEAVYFNASGAGTVQMTFYTPDGAYYTYSNTRKHLPNLSATGEYTVHVQYTSYAASGSYDLHYLRGGDSVENGALTSGGTRSSSLNPIDQDSYTFTANAGEAVYFNASGAGTVQMTFYTPDGAYYTYSNTRKHLPNLPATGEYTVHVQYTSYAASGSYDLHYLHGGDSVENGALTNDGTYSSSLNTVDQDSYTFRGNPGDSISFSSSKFSSWVR